MAGIIRGTGYNAGKLQRFGYMSVKSVKNTMLADKNQSFRAHEFHYYDSDNNGESCVAVKPVSGTSWTCIHEDDRNWWGYPHLYYPSNPEFARSFVEKAENLLLSEGMAADNSTGVAYLKKTSDGWNLIGDTATLYCHRKTLI